MTLTTLIVLVVLIALLVFIAQHVPAPFPWVIYLICALIVLVVLLRVLGLDVAL